MPYDPYKEAAAAVFGVSLDEVTPQQRAWAKRRAFVQMYNNPRKMSEFLNEQRYPNTASPAREAEVPNADRHSADGDAGH